MCNSNDLSKYFEYILLFRIFSSTNAFTYYNTFTNVLFIFLHNYLESRLKLNNHLAHQ